MSLKACVDYYSYNKKKSRTHLQPLILLIETSYYCKVCLECVVVFDYLGHSYKFFMVLIFL